ncbi:gag-pol, partial [Mucuna pruriens]
MLFHKEFNIEIKDKKGAENLVAHHLSRIERESGPMPIRDEFPDEQLLQLNKITPWFAIICNFIITSKFPPEASRLYKEKLESNRLYNDQVICKRIPDSKINSVLQNFVMQHLEQVIMDQLGQLEKPFLVSNGYSYILLVVDYMSRWVEAIATKTNDAKVIVDFLKSNIFYRFGVPKALISDQGSHFCNRAMSSLLEKYGVVHQIPIAYHP